MVSTPLSLTKERNSARSGSTSAQRRGKVPSSSHQSEKTENQDRQRENHQISEFSSQEGNIRREGRESQNQSNEGIRKEGEPNLEEAIESLSVLVMHLLEESSIQEEKVRYVNNGSPLSSMENNKLDAPPPPPKPFFKQRTYTALTGSADHLIELKTALMKRSKDPARIKQFKEEIEKLKSKLS